MKPGQDFCVYRRRYPHFSLNDDGHRSAKACQINQEFASLVSCSSDHGSHTICGKIASASDLSPREGPSAMLLREGARAIQLLQLASLSSVQKDWTSHALSKHGDDPLIKANLALSLSTKWITSLPLIFSLQCLLATMAGYNSACPMICRFFPACTVQSKS